MTAATTKIERSGPVIRATLAEFAPDECAQFEAEFRQAMEHVSEKFDLAPLDAVLDRWWGIAAIRANPLSEQERAQVTRARDGVFDGLWARDEDGNWVQLKGAALCQPDAGYDERTDQWTTTYGGGIGLIVYAVVHARQRVIILRLG